MPKESPKAFQQAVLAFLVSKTPWGSNPYTNVVKKWIEFTRAIKRDEVAGRYTERAPKNGTHQQQSIFSCQEIDTSILSKDEFSYGQEGFSRGSQHD